MTNTHWVTKYCKAFFDNRAQPDSQHDASIEGELAKRTESLVYAASGTTRTWHWPTVRGFTGYGTNFVAPRAQFSAVNTWTDFYVGAASNTDTRFQLPWRWTEDFDGGMLVYAQIATCTQVKILFRMNCETLLDACSSDGGSLGTPSKSPDGDVDLAGWWHANTGTVKDPWRLASYTSRLTPTSPPANRRIELVPQVYLDVPSDPTLDVSGTVEAHIVGLTVMDTIEPTVGGW